MYMTTGVTLQGSPGYTLAIPCKNTPRLPWMLGTHRYNMVACCQPPHIDLSKAHAQIKTITTTTTDALWCWSIACQGSWVKHEVECEMQSPVCSFYARSRMQLHISWPWLPPGIFKWSEGALPLQCSLPKTQWQGKTVQPWKRVQIDERLPWTSNGIARDFFWSKNWIHSNCSEVNAVQKNRIDIVVALRQIFGMFTLGATPDNLMKSGMPHSKQRATPLPHRMVHLLRDHLICRERDHRRGLGRTTTTDDGRLIIIIILIITRREGSSSSSWVWLGLDELAITFTLGMGFSTWLDMVGTGYCWHIRMLGLGTQIWNVVSDFKFNDFTVRWN